MTIVNINKLSWYEDKTWKRNLDIWLDAMKDDDDLLLVFDGQERSGKSKRMRQVAKYCASKLGTIFTPDNIHFELQDYLDFSLRSPEGTVCILDEGRNVLNKKSSTSKTNKKFTNYISECAKKKQVHLIGIPAFHDLDKYITNWRMKAVVHLHKWYTKNDKRESGYRLARGIFSLYMNNDYLKLKYNYPYQYPKRKEVTGKFNNIEVFTSEEMKIYEQKKDDGMEKKYHSESEEEQLTKMQQTWKFRWINLAKSMKKNRDISNGEIADCSLMESKTVSSHLAQSQF